MNGACKKLIIIGMLSTIYYRQTLLVNQLSCLLLCIYASYYLIRCQKEIKRKSIRLTVFTGKFDVIILCMHAKYLKLLQSNM